MIREVSVTITFRIFDYYIFKLTASNIFSIWIYLSPSFLNTQELTISTNISTGRKNCLQWKGTAMFQIYLSSRKSKFSSGLSRQNIPVDKRAGMCGAGSLFQSFQLHRTPGDSSLPSATSLPWMFSTLVGFRPAVSPRSLALFYFQRTPGLVEKGERAASWPPLGPLGRAHAPLL